MNRKIHIEIDKCVIKVFCHTSEGKNRETYIDREKHNNKL